MNKASSAHIKLSLPFSMLKAQGNCQNFLLAQLDGYTREHSIRVSKIAAKIGEQLLLEDDDLRNVATAGLFHDIGKIAINRDILYKNRQLSQHEKNAMQTHPEIGARIWLKAGGYYRISEAILHHHENWDGTGYPFGLRGEAIPLWGRIIAIADTLDAMLSARPYRRPFSLQQTLQTIQHASGKQFDPHLIARIYKSLRDNGFLPLFEALCDRRSNQALQQ